LTMLTIAFAVSEKAATEPNSVRAELTILALPAQTVLYTIVRGHYQKTGQAVGELFALAGKKAIQPTGSPT